MRNLFNTKLKIIVILAVLITAVLSVMSGLTNQSMNISKRSPII